MKYFFMGFGITMLAAIVVTLVVDLVGDSW